MATLASSQAIKLVGNSGLVGLGSTRSKPAARVATPQLGLRSSFQGIALCRNHNRAASYSCRSRPSPVASADKESSSAPPSKAPWHKNLSSLLPSSAPQVLSTAISETVRFLQKPAVTAAIIAAVLLGTPDWAMAAQGGGRVGGRSFDRGGSYGPSQTYTAPSQTYIAPSFSTPYYAPSPFFGGWSPFWSPGPTIVVGGGGFGFGGIFNILIIGAVLLFIANTVTGFLSNDEGVYATEKSSVVRLQVGLLGMARTLQKDLDRLADRADTDSPEGLHYILTETVLALMRHPDYCVYGRCTSEVKKVDDGGEAAFNRLSLEERGKFEQETLVSVGDVRKRVARVPKAERFTSEYIVVTILVAAEGDFKLPEVHSQADLKQALAILGSVPVEQLQAVEILWTPQNDEDTLSAQEMLSDYPQLRSL